MAIRKILEGRPFGHPIHPLITHLPLGLWLMGAVLDIVSFTSDTQRWALHAATWALVLGTACAIIAVVTGLNDWLDIRNDHPAQKSAMIHMALMIPATVLFIASSLLHFANRFDASVNGFVMALSIVGYLLALVGGYVGGLLVYDDGIAVGRHRRTTDLPQNTLHQPRSRSVERPIDPAAGLDAEHHPIIPEAALAEGNTLRVDVLGTVLILARAQGKVYAVQEFCTHRCGPLSEGAIDGCEIQCPWHNSRFDLATGKVTKGPAKVDLKTYDVRIKGGIIHVRGDKAAPAQEIRQPPPSDRRNPKEPESREPSRAPAPRRSPTEG